ncbi:hypothetical protein B0H17DRAFT_1138918 [Mycena rosella]|uniref:Uncharacterized protein n=1 Tax=Mycena rosella TaxID=1033263 RepID=A0AAD7D8Y5_MYCRO|nr:hypothetical protein B0H17DRAFT_1138918 [Mycena rosella]
MLPRGASATYCLQSGVIAVIVDYRPVRAAVHGAEGGDNRFRPPAVGVWGGMGERDEVFVNAAVYASMSAVEVTWTAWWSEPWPGVVQHLTRLSIRGPLDTKTRLSVDQVLWGAEKKDCCGVAPSSAVRELEARPQEMMAVEFAQDKERLGGGEGAGEGKEVGSVANGGIIGMRGIIKGEDMYGTQSNVSGKEVCYSWGGSSRGDQGGYAGRDGDGLEEEQGRVVLGCIRVEGWVKEDAAVVALPLQFMLLDSDGAVSVVRRVFTLAVCTAQGEVIASLPRHAFGGACGARAGGGMVRPSAAHAGGNRLLAMMLDVARSDILLAHLKFWAI